MMENAITQSMFQIKSKEQNHFIKPAEKYEVESAVKPQLMAQQQIQDKLVNVESIKP